MDRKKLWAEDFEGNRLSGEDMEADLTFEDMDNVNTKAVKSGMILRTNCPQCGKQVKELVNWAEIACWFLGKPVAGCAARRDGMHFVLACRCGKPSEMFFTWTEIRGFVDQGVGGGSLKPQIYQAAGLTAV